MFPLSLGEPPLTNWLLFLSWLLFLRNTLGSSSGARAAGAGAAGAGAAGAGAGKHD